MAKLFNHRDYITGRKLVKGFNVHHLRTEQDAENYCDISNEEEFIPLNSYCHKMLHYLFIFYQKDKTIMNRIREILDKMCDLSVKHGVDPVDLDHCIQDTEETEPQDEYDPEIDGDGGNEEMLEQLEDNPIPDDEVKDDDMPSCDPEKDYIPEEYMMPQPYEDEDWDEEKYGIPEQGPDEYISSEELGNQMLPKPEV